MVDVSIESPEQIEARLNKVIRLARMEIYPAPYTFTEFPLEAFPQQASKDALALVRDNDKWSQLVPTGPGDEAFMLVRFHFPQGVDNSGFVGWLASRFKHRFGSGVFVVCGQNNADGGIYDYWGVPLSVADAVTADLKELMAG
ncbi:hypothetical protein GJ698_02935 [Pseudoduganella sp. FT26W]|uniref:Uncharacterized protein n=1 Tax=Duganella aquatilis TaxID=2666082 RepID=A0A844D846_9BURK|nr:DUF6196 family protein [Duganella aquatilis]MRW83044.1 hypothetical protein [Duganella aquatilis]